MSDDEARYERFDVDNDFEGGQFIGEEFFYARKKQKRQQTEEDRLYGIFAEGSDSDEDRRGKRSKRGERADYSRPVNFISTGEVVQEEDEARTQQTFDVKPPSSNGDAGMGQESTRGLGSGGAGLGFTSAGPRLDGIEPEEEVDEEGVLPTAFGQRIKQRAAQRRYTEAKQHKQEKQRKAVHAADPDFAKFDKQNKFLKMLMKHGYKPGEGLGANKQGTVKPIEVKLRRKGEGLGVGVSHEEEEFRPAGPPTQAQASTSAAAAAGAAAKQPAHMWRKKQSEARQRREYKTASEVVAAAAEKPLAVQPILDMRGPQTRIITNLEHLDAAYESATTGDRTPMPELQHNLQLLVDLAEAEIQRLDGKLRHEQDTATLLAKDKDRLQSEAAAASAALARAVHVMNEVAKCQSHDRGASLSEVEQTYSALAKTHYEEYVMYNLAAAALAQGLPRLQAAMRGWQPLAEPRRGSADFARWRPLLESSSARTAVLSTSVTTPGSEDPYLTLISEVVLPPLRNACLTWQPRDPEPLLSFLEAWEPLLPAAAQAHILDMLVMPRLRQAVAEWEPRQETVPIHAWLHPWLPYLGHQLEELYPSIRHKLSMALTAWHPSDSSALVLLKPWHKVFDAADWDALLLKSIIPKLAFALQQLVIDPNAQDMNPFTWVMSWQEVLPLQHLVSLLETSFFPKWHQVLHFWLQHSPDYDEVTRWYLGWKSCFPPSVLDHERIRRQFNMALDAMNNAVEGAALPTAAASAYQRYGAVDEQPYAAAGMPGAGTAAAGPAPAAAAPAAAPAHWGPASELTLKDLVQRFAEEHNIEFLPKFGRFHDGLQVYAFGNTSIVLENTQSVIRAQLRDRWAPVSLETLLQQNGTRARR